MPKPAILPLDEQPLRAGLRLAVAVSGGADSVALLRALLERRDALGLVLSVIHVHHGIRGDEADRDQAFVQALATACGLQFFANRVDTPARVRTSGETVEEAARHLRYAIFQQLIDSQAIDAIATAHTLDDQAETVLQKLLRGAWTEGLGGISPIVRAGRGIILRPLLESTRADVEAFLRSLDQPWCEDSSNQDLQYTRNRIRHALLPILADYNPQISTQLSRLSTIARDEEAYWQRELARICPGMILPGKPVRGGGRSSSTHPEEASIALEIERLRPLAPAVQRRVLRWFAQQIGCTLDFDQTERLLQLAGAATSAAKRVDIDDAVSIQRTAREIQFIRQPRRASEPAPLAVTLPVPGEIDVPALGLRFTSRMTAVDPPVSLPPALIRYARAGDRVTQRYSRGPKKLKEVLERLHQSGSERQTCPVVAWPASDRNAAIVWLQGVELDPASLPSSAFTLEVSPIDIAKSS